MSIDRSEVLAYLQQWRDQLYLSGWTIALRCERLTDDRCGECRVSVPTWEATVRLDLGAIEDHGMDWRQVVIHELLHVVFGRIHAHSTAIFDQLGDPDQTGALAMLGNMEQEAAIEQLAVAFRAQERRAAEAALAQEPAEEAS